jgi:hypothetical protein
MSTITPPPVGGDEILELLSAESVEALATDDPQHDHLLYYAEADTNSILLGTKPPAPPSHSRWRSASLLESLGEEAHKEHDRSDAEAKRERQDRQPPFALFISSLGLPFYRLVVGLTPHVASLPPFPLDVVLLLIDRLQHCT